MSVTLPAGPVLSSGYTFRTFRRMRSWGASAPLVAWGMVTSGLLSTLALAIIGAFGAALAAALRTCLVAAEICATLAVALGMHNDGHGG